jgi:hypothetical protein
MSKRLSVEDRFWSKVDKSGDCWEWKAHIGRHKRGGYGRFRFRGQAVGAHRVAYILARGEIAPGMCVCHTCDNRICVNPDHLWLGTSADNTADMDAKGRRGKPRTPGPAHYKAAFTADQIRYIRHSPASGADLARAFNVSPSCICNIRKRKKYRNVI